MRFLLLSPLLLLLLLFKACRQSSESSFVSVRLCPNDSNRARLPLPSRLACASVCLVRPTCNIFNYNKVMRACYLGDACEELRHLWTDGLCVSYAFSGVSIAGQDSGLTTRLQLRLMYKFGTHGLMNLANQRASCLRSVGVVVDDGGAHFAGSSESYLEADTPGYDELLGYGSQYSFLLMTRHLMSTQYQFYYKFKHCTGTLTGNMFAKYNKYVYTYAYWPNNPVEYRQSVSPLIMPNDHQMTLVSVGLAFNGTGHDGFFYNGSLLQEVAAASVGEHPVSPDVFQCLRLGVSTSSANSLLGQIFCFVMSVRSLKVEEFQLLVEWCL